MAQSGRTVQSLLLAFFVSFVTLSTGSLVCEDLAPDNCSYSVASSGARCVLEQVYAPTGSDYLQCQTSGILSEKGEEYIESDACVAACGLSRLTFGLSTDVLFEGSTLERLCSEDCTSGCENIHSLYIKLAAGEGIYLPHLCQHRRSLTAAYTETFSVGPVAATTW